MNMTRHPYLLLLALLTMGSPGMCIAHSGHRGFVMLLPTRLYIIGGALVVALTFALVVAASMRRIRRPAKTAALKDSSAFFMHPWMGTSAASLLLLGLLIVTGFFGSRDPLANPLPLTLWTAWWVGFTFFTAVFGNVWERISPWHALFALLSRLPGLRYLGNHPLLPYPRWFGYWPAVAGFFGFAWVELVHPSPQDPDVLATLVLQYMLLNSAAMLLFGKIAWLHHGEPFSVFFRMVGWLSPFTRVQQQKGNSDNQATRRTLVWPGKTLLDLESLPVSGIAFVLLVLSAVSFDGLSRTFWWLDLVGENPLEYPGRSALTASSTLGLLVTFTVFAFAYAVTVMLGRVKGGDKTAGGMNRFVLSIIPIAFGYHFAHYLPVFLVDIQYAFIALSDPLGTGLNLFGTADLHVYASFLTHHRSVEIIWNVQIAAIVLAHVCAVIVAHELTLRETDAPKIILTSQLPATALMICYTVFGLWLLSTPIAG